MGTDFRKLFNKRDARPSANGSGKKSHFNLRAVGRVLSGLYTPFRFIVRKPVTSFLLASTSLGGLTQLAPDAVSKSLDDHMHNQGLPAISQYYSTGEINVYNRYTPLRTSHTSVFAERVLYSKLKNDDADIAGYALTIGVTPFRQFATQFLYLTTAAPSPINAYSITTRGQHEERVCFINPPARNSATNILNNFLNINAKAYNFKSDKAAVSDALYVYIMAHEARHCDQQFDVIDQKLMNETDADIYGLRVLQEVTKDPAVAQEVFDIMTHARIIASVMGNNSSHGTTALLETGRQTPVESVDAMYAYRQAYTLLDGVVRHNEDKLDSADKKMKRIEAFYHAAQALVQDPQTQTSETLYNTLQRFITAVEFFDSTVEGGILNTNPEKLQLDINLMTQNYTPAPDKIAQAHPAAPIRKP